jgi:hypothetical protein
MYDFNWYRRAFYTCLALFALGLIFPSTHFFYAIAFFGTSFLMVFEIGLPGEDIEHSSITHFDRGSRWNGVSYAKCFYLAFAALLYSRLAHFGVWTVLLLWLVGLLGMWLIEKYWEPKQWSILAVDYIASQLPALNKNSIQMVIDSWERGQRDLHTKVKHASHFDDETLTKIRHYYEVYKQHNG